MVTAEGVKAKLEGLIGKANGITGKGDATLTQAVASLIAGFGQGDGLLTARLTNSLIDYTNPDLLSIADYGFYNCTSLERVSCPNLTTVGKYSFSGCTALTEFDFSNMNPPAGYGSGEAFANTGLTHIVLPKMTTIPYNIFQNCGDLDVVDCHVVKTIQMQAFRYCTSLTTLILRNVDTIVTAAANIFANCGLGADTRSCAVYVPEALLDQYKVTTNWSAMYESGQIEFFAIEGSEYQWL